MRTVFAVKWDSKSRGKGAVGAVRMWKHAQVAVV